MTLQTALIQGQRLLEEAKISAPRLTAEVLLAHAVGSDRTWLYAHSEEELREVWWIHYGRYLHERLKGRPAQYITGHQEFYGRQFRVTPDVLIPRPETEHSIEAALQLAAHAKTVVDIGTGSGAIAVTLALETGARVIATDISESAARVARLNAQHAGAAIDIVVCDLGAVLAGGRFDLVISNPPYVPESDLQTVQKEVREYEPHVALFGGRDGLEVYRRLIPDAWRLLVPGGLLILEIGWREGDAIRTMLAGWQDIEIRTDLASIPRVVTARKIT
jgi:release factor glutamine methyltransferase